MTVRRRRAKTLLACAALVCTATACASPPDLPSGGGEWEVEVVADGLDTPWDLAVLPDGALLVSEKPGRLSTVDEDGSVVELEVDLDDVDSTGEGGLMGLAIDPAYADNNRLYTCHATADDIRVVAWTMSAEGTSATREPEPLVSGIEHASSGRHSGCQLEFDGTGALLVGTGDAAEGPNPQDLSSLNGKVLRIDPQTGEAPDDNPGLATPEIYSFGHRNVQGIALSPETGEIYTVEHGPDRDDEVNRLVKGDNYGWDPVGSGQYDESVPMTDDTINGAVPAVWSSGEPTIATSGAAFLTGSAWGEDEGLLAVAALKNQQLILMDVRGESASGVRSVSALDGTYGRLRAVTAGGDGIIYLTTSNGSDDKILKVSA